MISHVFQVAQDVPQQGGLDHFPFEGRGPEDWGSMLSWWDGTGVM